MWKLIEAGQETEEQRTLLARTPPINLFRLLGHHPPLAARIAALGAQVMNDEVALPARVRELIALRVGRLFGSAYVEGQHRRVAQRLGIPDCDIVGWLLGLPASDIDLDQQLLLRAVESMVTGFALEPNDVAAIELRWGDSGLIAIAVTVGYFTMLSLITRAAGLELESPRDV
ncbi:carboxymuconolactone decarboxylase family protein [Peristeroidobacter soli]|jgi:alkylhydroperoxidase family enzyme|uniref:carboxymuconolactone decarboxylase family protein n=1 Tax=Peristeroidobacter soli TaxID=2497877 RepID=UPI001FEBD28B